MKRLATLLFLIALAGTAHADGGRVRLQKTSGEFIITLFTAPEPLTTGEADFSVLVQDRATQQVILDPSIELELLSPSGEVEVSHLTHSRASNKMLQAATARLTGIGTWQATVTVRRGAGQEKCSMAFEVVTSHSRRTIVLIILVFPLLMIALFLVNQVQRIKHTSARK